MLEKAPNCSAKRASTSYADEELGIHGALIDGELDLREKKIKA